MTTQNAMMERQTADRIADLERRLAMSQKAVKELIEAKLVEAEGDRSRRVLEERERCAMVVEKLADDMIAMHGDNDDAHVNFAKSMAEHVIKPIARLIRTGEWSW